MDIAQEIRAPVAPLVLVAPSRMKIQSDVHPNRRAIDPGMRLSVRRNNVTMMQVNDLVDFLRSFVLQHTLFYEHGSRFEFTSVEPLAPG
jgi:hypothetical protein